MADRTFLTVDYLRQCVTYDPETGELTWLARPPEHFSGARFQKMWNTRFAGKPAFSYVGKRGYYCGRFRGKMWTAHRIAWLWTHGTLPQQQLDHINGIRTDNRLCNLRAVSPFENSRNSGMRSNNSSGHIGVWWNKLRQTWGACISIGNKTHHLGTFRDIKEAIAARKAAELKYGFHPNHGCVRVTKSPSNSTPLILHRGQ